MTEKNFELIGAFLGMLIGVSIVMMYILSAAACITLSITASNLGIVSRAKTFGVRRFLVIIASTLPIINTIFALYLLKKQDFRDTLFERIKTVETPEELAILLGDILVPTEKGCEFYCTRCDLRHECNTYFLDEQNPSPECIIEELAGEHRSLLPILNMELSYANKEKFNTVEDLPWGIYVKKTRNGKVIEEKFIQKKSKKNRNFRSKQDALKDFKHLKRHYYVNTPRMKDIYSQTIVTDSACELRTTISEGGTDKWIFFVTKEPRPGFYNKIRVVATPKEKKIWSIKGGFYESYKNLNTGEPIWKRCLERVREFLKRRG